MEFVISTPVPNGVSVAGPATPVARTVLMLANNDANVSAVIKEAGITFNGTSSTAVPTLVELVKCSLASNGTLAAAVTPVQWRGQGNTSGAGLTSKFLGYAGYVSEPTVITTLQPFWVPFTSGIVYPLPLSDEPELIAGSATMGLGIRVWASSAVNVHAYMRFVQGLT